MTDADDSQHDDAGGSEPPVVSARGIELKGARGRVYGPCTFDVPDGELTVIQGPPGSGRTSLLLTITGRMRQATGDLTILGLPYPKKGRRIRSYTAIAGFAEIDDLDEAVTVGEAIRERRTWAAPWYRPVRKVKDAAVADVCELVFGDRAIPSANTVIWELGQLDRLLLQVSLALIRDPYLLAVDDFEQIESNADRVYFTERLRAIASTCAVVTTAADSIGDPQTICHLDPGTETRRTPQAAR
ncbi:ATP-binding cassette domain-containing protein [Hoyosella subflava]|nr:ATP-binding cassette domain-containing protein [Hoyosella subflava]